MHALRIGQVARQAGVNIETIRYYERRHLIPAPPRLSSGYRQYPPDTVTRVRFIKRAQALGFSLNEIAELLAVRERSETLRHDARHHLLSKIAAIEGKIRLLQRMQQTLIDLADACHNREQADECPILEALQAEDVH